MSIHKFGYGAESLQKDKIENLEKEFESQTKLINIKLNDIQSAFGDKLKKFNTQSAFGNLQNIEEIQFNNDETNTEGAPPIIINAKLFLDINKSIEDIKKIEILRTRY